MKNKILDYFCFVKEVVMAKYCCQMIVKYIVYFVIALITCDQQIYTGQDSLSLHIHTHDLHTTQVINKEMTND